MESGQQVHHGRLPGPARPHQRRHQSDRHEEVDLLQDSFAGAVLHRHASVADPFAYATERLGIFPVADPDRGVQELEDPLGRGEPGLKEGGKLAKVLDRGVEPRAEKDEADKLATGERPLDDD